VPRKRPAAHIFPFRGIRVKNSNKRGRGRRKRRREMDRRTCCEITLRVWYVQCFQNLCNSQLTSAAGLAGAALTSEGSNGNGGPWDYSLATIPPKKASELASGAINLTNAVLLSSSVNLKSLT